MSETFVQVGIEQRLSPELDHVKVVKSLYDIKADMNILERLADELSQPGQGKWVRAGMHPGR